MNKDKTIPQYIVKMLLGNIPTVQDLLNNILSSLKTQ